MTFLFLSIIIGRAHMRPRGHAGTRNTRVALLTRLGNCTTTASRFLDLPDRAHPRNPCSLGVDAIEPPDYRDLNPLGDVRESCGYGILLPFQSLAVFLALETERWNRVA